MRRPVGVRLVQLAQGVRLGKLAHGLTAAVGPLALPESPRGVGQVALPQGPRPPPLQVHERDQADLRPPFHLGELPEPVAGEPERALEFLEEQLDLPALLPPKRAVGWSGRPGAGPI